MIRRLGLILAWAWVLASLTVAPAVRLAQHYLATPADPRSGNKVVRIPAGTSLRASARILAREGIITHPELFALLARYQGQGRKLKSGEYTLSAALPPSQVLRVVTTGVPLQHRITFPEGLTVREMAVLLDQAGLASEAKFLAAARDPALAASLGLPGQDLEGYLFPDTYLLPRGLKSETIIRIMAARFKEVFGKLKADTPPSNGLDDHQTVILASLVEAETSVAEERPLVAGVFVRRLKKGMLLQCDPTVSYGFPELEGRLLKRHLTDPHPYNTYIHKGLPPGPIGNPGASALAAALKPAQTKYLYFVSKNDGTHQFSSNYSQHQAAVNKYQR